LNFNGGKKFTISLMVREKGRSEKNLMGGRRGQEKNLWGGAKRTLNHKENSKAGEVEPEDRGALGEAEIEAE